MIERKGDLVEALKNGDVDALVHQVNCKGVMGSGIAAQIAKEFPKHYDDYIDYITDVRMKHGHDFKSKHLLTGIVVTVDPKGDICGIFGQDNYSRSIERKTNYAALFHGLTDVLQQAREKNLRVGIPKYIGCALGGGDWSMVEEFILDLEEIFEVEFYVYEL